jgi:hypothetical protein
MSNFQIDLIDFENRPAFGNKKYIMVIIDLYSRYAWTYSLTNKTPKQTKKFFEKWYKEDLTKVEKELGLKPGAMADFGHRPRIQTDRGGEFKGEFAEYLITNGFIHSFSTGGVPQTQGRVERFNGTFKRMLFRHMEGQVLTHKSIKARIDPSVKIPNATWEKYVPEVTHNYNHTFHTAIGVTPAYALLEFFNHQKPIDQKSAYIWQKKIYDAKMGKLRANGYVKEDYLKAGDKVRVKIRVENKKSRKETIGDNWSKEIYTVLRVYRKINNPISITKYKVDKTQNEPKDRTFTAEELQKVWNKDDLFDNDKDEEGYLSFFD